VEKAAIADAEPRTSERYFDELFSIPARFKMVIALGTLARAARLAM
jgi:hypothetical protein